MLNSQKVPMKSNDTIESRTPPTEVVPATKKAQRRRFTLTYKLRILEEAANCTEPGQLGALLRREGLYSSHLSRWRELHKQDRLAGTDSNKRGPKPLPSKVKQELDQLRKQNQQLQQRLAAAETIIDVQKKISVLLELTNNSTEQS